MVALQPSGLKTRAYGMASMYTARPTLLRKDVERLNSPPTCMRGSGLFVLREPYREDQIHYPLSGLRGGSAFLESGR